MSRARYGDAGEPQCGRIEGIPRGAAIGASGGPATDARAARLNAEPIDADLSGRRILVVEDEMLVAMLMEDILAELGCTVVGPAARVAEALPLAENQTLDCAFLDVNVAGERVFPVAAALAARAVPFVFVSGYGEEALEPPFAGRPALKKPFPPSEIETVLRRCLAGATAAGG